MSHTPGPWKAKAMGGYSVVLAEASPKHNRSVPIAYGYEKANGYSIALPFSYLHEDKEVTRRDFAEFCHDDARLIAAAPDMLAALTEAYQYMPFHNSDCEGVTSYAEGSIFDETKGCTCYLSRMRAAIAKATGAA